MATPAETSPPITSLRRFSPLSICIFLLSSCSSRGRLLRDGAAAAPTYDCLLLLDLPGLAAAGGGAGGQARGGAVGIEAGAAVEVPGVAGIPSGADLAVALRPGARAGGEGG